MTKVSIDSALAEFAIVNLEAFFECADLWVTIFKLSIYITTGTTSYNIGNKTNTFDLREYFSNLTTNKL